MDCPIRSGNGLGLYVDRGLYGAEAAAIMANMVAILLGSFALGNTARLSYYSAVKVATQPARVRKRVRLACFCGLLALALAGGCKDAPTGSQPTSAGATASAAPKKTAVANSVSDRGFVHGGRQRRDPALALRTFLGRFVQYERVLKNDPKHLPTLQAAAQAYQNKLSYLGDIKALDRAVELAESLVRFHPKKAVSYIVRASARVSGHRFLDGLKDLDRAKKMGARPDALRRSRAMALVGLGRYDEALPLLQAARKAQANASHLGLEAMCLGHMLRFAEAQRLFEQAEKTSQAGGPFTFAWLYSARAGMWKRAGEARRAQRLWRAAVERLPQFAHAVGHLASSLPPEEGRQLLIPLIKESDDPEYLGSLSLMEDKLVAGGGKVLREKAQSGYEVLMKRHPLAFADHAGWFYLKVVKKASRAVEVAELNLKNRKTPDAYELVVRALIANQESDEACLRAEQGLRLPYVPLALREASALAFSGCGREDAAKEQRDTIASQRASMPRAKTML